jgi:hypothetical protein
MSRKLSLLAVAAALAAISTQSAHAQLGLGKYQQGLVNSISASPTAGGEAAGLPGAIVVGVAAAGYYDTQHQGQIVHDHRAPRVSWTCFDHGN